MAFEEQIEQYRAMKPVTRLGLMAIIGLLLPAYLFFEDGAKVEKDLSEIEAKHLTAKTAFEEASKKKEKISELSENLESTKEQLELATKLLPDDFLMDEILQATAEVADDLGILLEGFSPKEVVRPYGDIKYEELPIELRIRGNFNKIAVFYDRLVHMDKLVHLRQLRIDALPFSTGMIEDWNLLTPAQKAKKAGEKSVVLSSAQMVVFRGLR